jgi:hypothetical protein
MDITRAEVYKSLKKLSELGLVQVIADNPYRFKAIPLNRGLNELICHMTERINKMKRAKLNILKMWNSTFTTDILEHVEFFRFVYSSIEGAKAICDAVGRARIQILYMTTKLGIARAKKYGTLKAFRKAVLDGVPLKLLLEVTKDNLCEVQSFSESCKGAHTNLEIRHLEGSRQLAVLIDYIESIVALTIPREVRLDSNFVHLWTNNRVFTENLCTYFDELWKKSIPLTELRF